MTIRLRPTFSTLEIVHMVIKTALYEIIILNRPDWLFQHVAAVVHHGGAGTTACGLQNGRPTVIVPFFGELV